MFKYNPITCFLFLLIPALWGCDQHTAGPVSAQVIQYQETRDSTLIRLAPDLSVPPEDPGYTLILPEGEVKGMAVLFHSGRDTSHQGYEMRFYAEAVRREVAVMYVTTGNPFEFLFEEQRYEQLDRYLGLVLDQYPVPRDRLLFSGMSLAGTRAVKFGLWCLQGASQYDIRPHAIAICDAPLDFLRFWNEGAFAIRYQIHPASANEATWANHQLETHLGGTPAEVPDRYAAFSPYVRAQTEIDPKLKYFRDVAIRAYTEPDVQWWLENRQKDYYGINAVDAAGLIRDLRLLGNTRAELITTTGKGHHPGGTRHPHSWSIVDGGELVEWMLK